MWIDHRIRFFFFGGAARKTLEHLETNFPNMCQKGFENYLKRIEVCKNSWDSHLNDAVFQI